MFSQNKLYICVEHYFGTENFIHKNNSSMAHLNGENEVLKRWVIVFVATDSQPTVSVYAGP